MKLLRKAFLLISAGVFACSGVACNNQGEVGGAQSLQIYCLDAGYGTEWLDSLISDFKNQSWVKEKYPNLVVGEPEINDIETYAAEKINSGKNSNQTDLFFSFVHSMSTVFVQGQAEELSDVYSSTVPGEDLTVQEKMKDEVAESNMFYDNQSKTYKYYSMPWAGGIDGILYNADILSALGYSVPNTTNELIAICEGIKTKNSSDSKFDEYKETYSIMASTTTDYWRYLYQEWWAQYDGIEGTENYYDGVVDGALSKYIFAMKGRLETLKVMDELLSGENGYMSSDCNVLGFMTAQTNLLMGKGIFQANGDWFEREMKTTRAGLVNRGYDYEIKLMKTPVISAIINKTPSITNDEMLSAVISAIDEGATEYTGVTAADFNIIKDARSVVVSEASRHGAVIPVYSDAKDVAKDFLRYMATDGANVLYSAKTEGSCLPYKGFDITSTETYQGLSSLQKSANDILNHSVLDVRSVLTYSNKPLVYYGGLGDYACASEHLEIIFFDDKKSAQELFDEEINYWTDSRWSRLLQSSGLL